MEMGTDEAMGSLNEILILDWDVDEYDCVAVLADLVELDLQPGCAFARRVV
jgi:hypothetical protein